MNKLILIIAILFSGMLMQAQDKLTDLDIAQKIMCKYPHQVSKILNEYGIEVDSQDDERAVIVNNGVVKTFGFEIDKKAGGVIDEVLVRYHRGNPYHREDFTAYDLPYSDEKYFYERKMGKTMGHLIIKANCRKR